MSLYKLLPIAALLLAGAASATPANDPAHAKARELLERTVNIPTTPGSPKLIEMANYLAGEYRKAGFPEADIKVMPYEKVAALIVRWRAPNPSARPIMLMAHMDVVEARREDWGDTDPFVFTEKDGYYYGRGTSDIKQGIAATSAALMKLKAEGFQPTRDIIVFYTGDEETVSHGAELGATEWRNLLDVEFGLNADGGGGAFAPDGRPLGFSLQSAEKTYATYTFTVRNRGGHSSKPRADNAIYALANALARLEKYRFTPVMNETTRAYFAGREKTERGALGNAMRAWLKNPKDGRVADLIEADEGETGLTRTRCVATRLAGGHADNALPQLATATVNCRIMPGVSPDAIKVELEKIAADKNVAVTRNDQAVSSLDSPLRADVVNAYTDAVKARHPNSPVFPEMSAGASDANPFRIAGIPIYGVDGSWGIVPTDMRAHGRDERLPVKALDDDVDHWVFMLRRLAGKP
ncbi:M20/M25/M40 family metallo-hydrolase [Massilia sp. ST3]|uniref:M20/M25/M40 family metallo-hydrolase n=1 Tax=Massilia sp. ST3 TaxID=2824903 RepID=UPI001B82ADBA|nr:M20/M25/M40 family metallo-hydrolase [Massilia sp. ST3]MBQ5947512.1 M20/M25/M40 family metallo-hydrolase [Massilia sp. ST3]